jgi:hypothetical protein
MRGRIWGVLAVAVGLVLPGSGQIARSRTTTATEGNTASRTQLPYTAEFRTTRVQTLPDGGTVTQESTQVMARDSAGRTYNASTSTPMSEDQTPNTMVNVFDPGARTHSFWTVPGQRATVTNEPAADAPRATCAAPSTMPVSHSEAVERARPALENLGKQTFQGIEAHGHRTTFTTAAGAIGNTEPMVSTDEVWFSSTPGLAGINVHQVNENPQTGRMTRELVRFTQGEPDAALFQPPDGYEVLVKETKDEVRCPQ